MEFIIEFLLELLIEGSIELLPNKRIPKWIRYLLAFIVISFFTLIIGILIFLGICMIKENIIISIIFICLGLFLLIRSIFRFKKVYKEKSN